MGAFAEQKRIRNIVFDLGGVLVDFDPERCMEALGFSAGAREAFRERIFSGFWVSCDRLDYGDAEIRAHFKRQVPGFEAEVDRLWDHLTPITGVRPYSYGWLSDLKARGYRIYILSNYGRRSFEINSALYDFLELADGRVISWELGIMKPEPGIYLALCERYGLAPEECVFLDDRTANVEAAVRLGFSGIVFQDYPQASKELSALLQEADLT